MPDHLFRLRVKLAWLIFPKIKHYADIDVKTQCRKLALEEAAKICDELARESEQGKYSHGRIIAYSCASRIRYRSEHGR